MRTTFPEENEDSGVPDTVLTQNPPASYEADVQKWPKKVKHRKKVLAKIYLRTVATVKRKDVSEAVAAHANENLTAQQAGNSPAMVPAHYKVLGHESRGAKMVCRKTGAVSKRHLPARAQERALRGNSGLTMVT